MENAQIRANADYQVFTFDNLECPEGRMSKKLQALSGVFPDFEGKKVLDIGCDFGYWSFLAASRGAEVVGLDRGRSVRGEFVNLPRLNNESAKEQGLNAKFLNYEAGRQFHDLGRFDFVFMMSLYHHIYQNTGGDHESIWYWLWTLADEVIWENPTDSTDRVVQMNVSEYLHLNYVEGQIRFHALKYFNIDYEGPALHETTRVVWRLRRKKIEEVEYQGIHKKGAGGASPAFLYANERRISELENILGVRVLPGSLNLVLEEDFNWDERYFRAPLLDVIERGKGLDVLWDYRAVRLYPVMCDSKKAWVMRFEGDGYPLNFVELISDQRLEDGNIDIHRITNCCS
jgi:SAM-dependent methyltransferase